MKPPRSLAPFLSLGCLLAACGGDGPAKLSDQDRSTAGELVAAYAGALKSELQAAVAEGGPASGVRICSERAPEIAAEVTAEHPGWSIRRIGSRVRNTETNTPSATERQILDEFATLPAAERPGPLVAADPAHPHRLYRPIFVTEPVCLTCHGPAEEIPEGVRAQLAEHYPDDAATGYALGDLRGAFVVEKR